jgi:hypothetical protein
LTVDEVEEEFRESEDRSISSANDCIASGVVRERDMELDAM